MAVHPLIRAYQNVAERLPFHLDDVAHVTALVHAYRAAPTEERRNRLMLWVYAYVCRYFAGKVLLHEFSATEADLLISKAMGNVTEHLDEVRDDDLFIRWVSVICKNLWLGELRRHQRDVEIEEHHGAVMASEGFDTRERLVVLQEIQASINRLPDYLRGVARMRLLESRSYAEICKLTGLEQPTLRVYFRRALKRLREDARLRDLLP